MGKIHICTFEILSSHPRKICSADFGHKTTFLTLAVGPAPEARVRSLATEGSQTEELKTCLREYRLPQRGINGRNRVPKAAFDQTGRYSSGDIRRIHIEHSLPRSPFHPMTSFVASGIFGVRQFEEYPNTRIIQGNSLFKTKPKTSACSTTTLTFQSVLYTYRAFQ